MLTQSLRITTVFFTIFVSPLLFSMNYPVKNKKRVEISTLKQPSYTSWDSIEVSEAVAQTSFGSVSKDLFFPMLAMFSPSVKNGLRKTNKVFNYLLSWEEIQPFMLCNPLSVTINDLHNLMMQNIDSYQEQESNSALKKLFLKNVGFDLEKDSLLYEIPGYFGQKNIKIIVAKNALEKVKKLSNSTLVSGVYSLNEVHPLVKICMARNSIKVKEYLEKNSVLERKSYAVEDIKRLLSIVICNNDGNSLLQMIDNRIIKPRMIYPVVSECVQLALMHASPNVLSLLIPYYLPMRGKAFVFSDQYEERNFISGWFDLPTIHTHQSLDATIKDNHKLLTEKHKNNTENYHQCLDILFDEKRLEKLDPTVAQAVKSHKKSRIIFCSIV